LLTSVVIVVGSFFKGLGKALWDALKGIADIIAHPIETLKNLFHAIAHPIDTIKAIWQSISESFIRDVIHGDAKSRAEWFGYALGEIVLAVVGTKGADKVGKMARASKLARKGSSLLEKLHAPVQKVQKVFTKDFWKNAASTLFRKLNINWKNAAITALGAKKRGEITMDKFIKSKEELIVTVRKLINVEFSEEEETEILSLLEKSVPDFKELMRLIYWSDNKLTPEEIVEKVLRYQPIIIPPPSDD
jgi:hypothetical protein